MSNDDIEDIRARWAAASPWPWAHDIDGSAEGWPVAGTGQDASGRDHGVSTQEMPCGELADTSAAADAEAIAHAPEDVAWLLAEVERLSAELAACITIDDAGRVVSMRASEMTLTQADPAKRPTVETCADDDEEDLTSSDLVRRAIVAAIRQHAGDVPVYDGMFTSAGFGLAFAGEVRRLVGRGHAPLDGDWAQAILYGRADVVRLGVAHWRFREVAP